MMIDDETRGWAPTREQLEEDGRRADESGISAP
jgi:hypothetical protein